MRSNGEDQKLYSPIVESRYRLRSMAVTAADNFVIDEDMPPLLFLNNAGAIDVLLPESTEARKGLCFWVWNESANAITMKTSLDAGFTTAIVLAAGEGTMVVCTGSATPALGWRAMGTASSA